MKVGDLVIYRAWASTYEGTGLVHAVKEVSVGDVRLLRYKISWPAKPAHMGKTMTWELARDVEVVNEGR